MEEPDQYDYNDLTFGFSENDDFLTNREALNRTSPIGSYPSESRSPIGSYPGESRSPIGSYLGESRSPIGRYPGYNGSSTGSYSLNNATVQGSSQAHINTVYNSGDPQHVNDTVTQNDGFTTRITTSDSGVTVKELRKSIPKSARILFLGWMTLTVIFTVVLSILGETWSIIFEIIQITGLVTAFSAFRYNRKLRGSVICIVSSCVYMCAVAAFRFSAPERLAYCSQNVLVCLLPLIFVLLGAAMIAYPITNYRTRTFRCTRKVEAAVIEVLKHKQNRRTGNRRKKNITYCPKFEYTFLGIRYTATEDVFSNSYTPVVGMKGAVYVDPDDPTYITDAVMHRNGIIIFSIFGGVFALFGIIGLFITILI